MPCGIDARNVPVIAQELRLTRTAAIAAFGSVRTGEATPCACGVVDRPRNVVAVPDRGLNLKAGNDAEFAKFGGVFRHQTRKLAVMFERRRAEPGREPDFIAGRAVLFENSEGAFPDGRLLLPDAETDDHERTFRIWFVHAESPVF